MTRVICGIIIGLLVSLIIVGAASIVYLLYREPVAMELPIPVPTPIPPVATTTPRLATTPITSLREALPTPLSSSPLSYLPTFTPTPISGDYQGLLLPLTINNLAQGNWQCDRWYIPEKANPIEEVQRIEQCLINDGMYNGIVVLSMFVDEILLTMFLRKDLDDGMAWYSECEASNLEQFDPMACSTIISMDEANAKVDEHITTWAAMRLAVELRQ